MLSGWNVHRFRFDNNCAVHLSPEQNPDVELLAFGRRWPCHREILSQSNFFCTLFNGSFRESKLSEVEIKVRDDLIDENSFQKLLDVLYKRQTTFTSDDIFNVTVTAQYFQMTEIVNYCEDKICEMVRSSNAIDFYHFADRYFLKKTKDAMFQWMLLRLLPVKCWEELSLMSVELAEQLISNPRLVTQNELYLYMLLKMLIQIDLNGTCVQDNESFYKPIRDNPTPFLETSDGAKFARCFQFLRLKNIIVRKENIELLLRDNIIPRSVIDGCVFSNWMSLVSIESPENFGPTLELVSKEEFEVHAMRFAKMIHSPDFHSWKFVGFSFAFDLALFFDGRTLIIKRVHQINEHKISHSHLMRRIMLRFDISEMNSCEVKRSTEIQCITLATNEEVCLRQLKRETNYPCRISIEVLFHVPYKPSQADRNLGPMRYERDNEEQNTGSSFRSSIKARAFKSYKKFFN